MGSNASNKEHNKNCGKSRQQLLLVSGKGKSSLLCLYTFIPLYVTSARENLQGVNTSAMLQFSHVVCVCVIFKVAQPGVVG